MDKPNAWEYMHANASLETPTHVSFFEEQYDRLYRSVDLDTIRAHGWEMISVLLVSTKEGMRYEYFFKRPKKDGAVTLFEKQENS